MNPHFLICVEKPTCSLNQTRDEAQQCSHWRDLLEALASKPMLVEGAEKLAENIWLLPVHSKLSSLLPFLEAAKSNQLAYKVYFLESEPLACQ